LPVADSSSFYDWENLRPILGCVDFSDSEYFVQIGDAMSRGDQIVMQRSRTNTPLAIFPSFSEDDVQVGNATPCGVCWKGFL
jgi:hypothetical protein